MNRFPGRSDPMQLCDLTALCYTDWAADADTSGLMKMPKTTK